MKELPRKYGAVDIAGKNAGAHRNALAIYKGGKISYPVIMSKQVLMMALLQRAKKLPGFGFTGIRFNMKLLR